MQRHDAFMRLPWNTSKIEQLDLVDAASAGPVGSLTSDAGEKRVDTQTAAAMALPSLDELVVEGQPLLVPTDSLDEDPANPRTEFPDEELAELRRRAERAEAELAKAKKVIEIQGNVSALLEQMLGTEGDHGSTER